MKPSLSRRSVAEFAGTMLLFFLISSIFDSTAVLWSGLLAALTLILIARTGLDIWFSNFNGRIVRSIVSKKQTDFLKEGLTFAFMMWPMVNNNLLI